MELFQYGFFCGLVTVVSLVIMGFLLCYLTAGLIYRAYMDIRNKRKIQGEYAVAGSSKGYASSLSYSYSSSSGSSFSSSHASIGTSGSPVHVHSCAVQRTNLEQLQCQSFSLPSDQLNKQPNLQAQSTAIAAEAAALFSGTQDNEMDAQRFQIVTSKKRRRSPTSENIRPQNLKIKPRTSIGSNVKCGLKAALNKCQATQLSSNDQSYVAVRDLIINTFHKKHHVFSGNDAKGLQYSRLKVTKIYQLENAQLSQRYLSYKDDIKGRQLQNPDTFMPLTALLGGRKQIETIQKASGILTYDCDESLNECYLFQGTQLETAKAILLTGFKKEKGSESSLFGQATYLAESSAKATQYSDLKDNRVPNGTRLYMLLVRTCLGRMHHCHGQTQYFHQPPCIYGCDPNGASCKHPRCHSVVGTHKQYGLEKPVMLQFREFVLYDDAACLPEFLVEYIRV